MNAAKIAALAVMVPGFPSLAYGSFTCPKETHEAKVGPVEFSVKDNESVNIPVWASVGAKVIGLALYLFGSKKT